MARQKTKSVQVMVRMDEFEASRLDAWAKARGMARGPALLAMAFALPANEDPPGLIRAFGQTLDLDPEKLAGLRIRADDLLARGVSEEPKYAMIDALAAVIESACVIQVAPGVAIPRPLEHIDRDIPPAVTTPPARPKPAPVDPHVILAQAEAKAAHLATAKPQWVGVDASAAMTNAGVHEGFYTPPYGSRLKGAGKVRR